MGDLMEPLISKILVDSNADNLPRFLRDYFNKNNLQGVTAKDNLLIDLLNVSTDLGGVFMSLDTLSNDFSGINLVEEIHGEHPELPIFLYLDDEKNKDTELVKHLLDLKCTLFTDNDTESLDRAIEENIFCTYYPVPMIKEFQAISNKAFLSINDDLDVSMETPFIVKSRVIYGELFSLMAIESNWYNGFMMIQSTYQELGRVLSKRTQKNSELACNDLLNELTNLIYGGMKASFSNNASDIIDGSRKIQIPTIINHQKKYISFGGNQPQLCFKFLIKSKTGVFEPFSIFHKLVFNVSWEPGLFDEASFSADDLVDSGELELF